MFRIDILRADLQNTGCTRVRRRENRTEIKIVREQYVPLRSGVRADRLI